MTILVVGAAGNLGAKIVRELLARNAAVRVSHRAGKSIAIEGVEQVVADLADPASLARACDGIAVVVSAVQGLRDVIVDGQTNLVHAAEQAGVARMIPSDYSLDFFKTTEGGNRNLDLRRELDRVLDASKVRGTSVLCGAFMDLLAAGRIGPDAHGVFKVWGDPDQIYDYTHTDDVAKYIAAVALDHSAGRVVRVSGESISPRALAKVFEAVRGTPVTLENAGSVEQLGQVIARMRAADEAPHDPFPIWQQMAYMHDMASGQGRLDPIDNARYPAIHPRGVREVISAGAAR